MKYAIQIPKPCNENWDQMTPADRGRHCAQCDKTVIDFSQWQQEDILHYIQNTETNVCGRFRQEQVNVPITVEQFTMSVSASRLTFHKKLAAILLFAFGMLQMSCDNSHNVGETAYKPAIIADTTKKDSTITGTMTIGKPIPPPHHAKKPIDSIEIPVEPVQHHLMGGAVAHPIPVKAPDKIPEQKIMQGEVQLSKPDTTTKVERNK